MRLLGSGLSRADVEPKLKTLVARLFANIPTGVGASRKDLRLSRHDLRRVLGSGAQWAVNEGLGHPGDLRRLEEGGRLDWADPDAVSDRALERGVRQLGTLGSGNHFAEIQYVAEIYDGDAAHAFGLTPGQVTVMIHSGSRGLGHQVCEDHLRVMIQAAARYGIALPDRQLCCAPIDSPEGRAYLGAMAAAANFAFANRQVMTHWVRESFHTALGIAADLPIVYDVCHNIAKFEQHVVDGAKRRVCVHRKGATRAFPPGHPELGEEFRTSGQPVLIPGDMGRYSYVLAGTEGAFEQTFGSACHGAGRRLSRTQAKKAARGRSLVRELADQGIEIMAAGMATIAEEMPEAYKDVADVVAVVGGAGLANPVARLKPIGVIKG